MVTFLLRVLLGLLTGVAIGDIVGLSGPLAGALGLADDFVLIFAKQSLSITEGLALTFFVDEGIKLLDAAEWYQTHSRRHREYVAHLLARYHPHEAYIVGNFSYVDAARLAFSAETLANRGYPLVAEQAAAWAYDTLLDILEVADVLAF